MNKNLIIKSILCFSLFVLVFVSCKVFSNLSETTPANPVPKEPEKPVYHIAYFDYDWFSSRMNASIYNTDKQEKTADIMLFMVIRKDSIIYINASKMAIEFARIVLTPDSVKYINHITLTYYVGDYSIVKKMLGFPVDFYMVQALLMNNDFPNFETDFSVTQSENQTILNDNNRKCKQSSLKINQQIVLNDNDRIIENNMIENTTNDTIRVSYSDFYNLTSVIRIPQTIELNVYNQKMKIVFSLKDPKINVPGPTYFKITPKYKLLEFNQ
jgi:hypothetical protein